MIDAGRRLEADSCGGSVVNRSRGQADGGCASATQQSCGLRMSVGRHLAVRSFPDRRRHCRLTSDALPAQQGCSARVRIDCRRGN